MQDRNSESLASLKQEIQEIQNQCFVSCTDIQKNHLENNNGSSQEETLKYVEGVRVDIQNSSTHIPCDNNLLINQFLSEMGEKLNGMEELVAYSTGVLHDLNNGIDRLNSLTRVAREAKTAPQTPKQDVQPEHVHKARQRFQLMKTELQGLIQSLFPQTASMVTEVLGLLMQEKVNESSDGYIPVTQDKYDITEMLKDMNIVVVHPYNNELIKLAN